MKFGKKILTALLSVSVGLSTFMASDYTSAVDGYITGDINNDGHIDVTDLTYMSLFLNGERRSAGAYMAERLDVNCDNIINRRDYDEILNIMSNPGLVYIGGYQNLIDPLESATDELSYKKVDLYGSTPVITEYELERAQVIEEYSQHSLDAVNDIATLSLNNHQDGIVKLTVYFGNQVNVATGFVVGPNTILTAASNLYKQIGSTYQYSDYVECDVYSVSGTFLTGDYSASYYHIPSLYLTSSVNKQNYNYAIVKLGNGINLSNYAMKLGMTMSGYNSGNPTLYRTSVSTYNNSTITSNYQLYSQKVYKELINYTPGSGEYPTQYGAPLYIRDDNSDNIVIGITCDYAQHGFMDHINRAVRIDQDIFRFVYCNTYL